MSEIIYHIDNIEPVSNNHLKSLKKIYDEEVRINNINRSIKTIYENVIQFAKYDERPIFKYKLDEARVSCVRNSDIYESHLCRPLLDDIKFIKNNINEIINGLKNIFPESKIEYINSNCLIIDWS